MDVQRRRPKQGHCLSRSWRAPLPAERRADQTCGVRRHHENEESPSGKKVTIRTSKNTNPLVRRRVRVEIV